jgi:hypothetical protein
MQNNLKKAEKQQVLVVTKALKKSADYWEISNKHLGEILGLSEASISRLKNGNYDLDYNSKQWQLALLFLRAFRGLDAYMGGNSENEKLWLAAHNDALGGAPFELMKNVEGLSNIVQYIDCMRGQ